MMMIPIEDQVCSLKLARQLKELGVKQESLFLWKQYDKRHDLWHVNLIDEEWDETSPKFSAFTVSDFGEMLPYAIVVDTTPYFLQFDKDYLYFRVCYRNWISLGRGEFKFKDYKIFDAKTEVEARAKMLCYLIQNKLIEVSK